MIGDFHRVKGGRRLSEENVKKIILPSFCNKNDVINIYRSSQPLHVYGRVSVKGGGEGAYRGHS